MYILPVTGFIHHKGELVVYCVIILCSEETAKDGMVLTLLRWTSYSYGWGMDSTNTLNKNISPAFHVLWLFESLILISDIFTVFRIDKYLKSNIAKFVLNISIFFLKVAKSE